MKSKNVIKSVRGGNWGNENNERLKLIRNTLIHT